MLLTSVTRASLSRHLLAVHSVSPGIQLYAQPQPAAKRGAGKSHLRSLRRETLCTRAPTGRLSRNASPFPNTIGRMRCTRTWGTPTTIACKHLSSEQQAVSPCWPATLTASRWTGPPAFKSRSNPFDFRKDSNFCIRPEAQLRPQLQLRTAV